VTVPSSPGNELPTRHRPEDATGGKYSVCYAVERDDHKAFLIYEAPAELDKQDRIGFWFSLLVTVTMKTARNYPDVVEWDTVSDGW